jgi:hypothetical protein
MVLAFVEDHWDLSRILSKEEGDILVREIFDLYSSHILVPASPLGTTEAKVVKRASPLVAGR